MRKRQSPAVMPTPGQWAQEKLKQAPARSGEWARRVARIYCLDISDDQEGAVTPEGREAIRRTGARDSRASRAAAGLHEHIEDPAAAAQLAGLMRDTPRPGARQPAKPRTGSLGGSPPHAAGTRRSRDTGRPRAHRPRQMAGMGITGVQDRQAPPVERTRRARLDRPPDRMTGPQMADGCGEYGLGPERPSPGLRKRRGVPGSRSRRPLVRMSRGITDCAASLRVDLT